MIPLSYTHTHCVRIPENEVALLAKELRARGLEDVAKAVEDEAHREALSRAQQQQQQQGQS